MKSVVFVGGLLRRAGKSLPLLSSMRLRIAVERKSPERSSSRARRARTRSLVSSNQDLEDFGKAMTESDTGRDVSCGGGGRAKG